MKLKYFSTVVALIVMFVFPMSAMADIFTAAAGTAAAANIPGLVNTASDGIETIAEAGAERAAEAISGMSNSIQDLNIQTAVRVGDITAGDESKVTIGDSYFRHVRSGNINVKSDSRLGNVQVDKGGTVAVGRMQMTDTDIGNVDFRSTVNAGRVNVGRDASVSLGNAFLQ